MGFPMEGKWWEKDVVEGVQEWLKNTELLTQSWNGFISSQGSLRVRGGSRRGPEEKMYQQKQGHEDAFIMKEMHS